MYANEFASCMFKLSRGLKVHLEENLAPALTEGQLVVLEYLMSNEPVKPSDLIDYLSTTPAAITTLLDRMEKNGLIVRERDESDRRIVWIKLTEKATIEGKRGMEIRDQYLQQSLNRISAHNQQLFIYLLKKITAQT